MLGVQYIVKSIKILASISGNVCLLATFIFMTLSWFLEYNFVYCTLIAALILVFGALEKKYILFKNKKK